MQYRARRRLTSFEVFLTSDRGRFRADILDVTEGGVRLRLDIGNLDPDSTVSLEIQGRAYPCRVVWALHGEAGVAFDGPLPLDAFAAINRSVLRSGPAKKKRFLMP